MTLRERWFQFRRVYGDSRRVVGWSRIASLRIAYRNGWKV